MIPFVSAPTSDHLFEWEGKPVFPVCSRRSLDRLRHVAQLHCDTLCDIADAGRPCARPGNGGTVVALGARAEPFGQLYAHLTGRDATHVSERALDFPPDARVFVMATSSWTRRVCDAIEAYAKTRADGVGIILGSSDEALWDQVLCRAAARQASASRMRKLTLLMADGAFGRAEHQGSTALGAQARLDDVRAVAQDPNDLLVLYGHGDGFDAGLSGGGILCGFRDDRHDDAAGRRPACLERDICHRVGALSITEAWAGGRLVDPGDFRACIMLLESCSALPVANSLVEPRLTLGNRFLAEADFGVLVASPEICVTEKSFRQVAVDRLRRAEAVGVCVTAINASPEAEALGRHYFIFGDPDYGLPC
jgi:hypothetical protein